METQTKTVEVGNCLYIMKDMLSKGKTLGEVETRLRNLGASWEEIRESTKFYNQELGI